MDRIEKYARALINHDLLAVTDGAVKRSDGKPVNFQITILYRFKQLVISVETVLKLKLLNLVLGVLMEPSFLFMRLLVLKLLRRILVEDMMYRQIIKEMELKTIVCSVSNALSILMNYDRFTEFLVGLKNIVIVRE